MESKEVDAKHPEDVKEFGEYDGEVSHIDKVDKIDRIANYDDSIESTKVSTAVWLITFTVATGGFLFVISAVLVTLKSDLGHELSSSEQEMVTSLTSGGALVGALIARLPADKYGRKFGIYAGCALLLIGSVIQAAAFSVAQMAVGRLVVGLGVGSAAMIIPLYIGELAPAPHRGRMIALDNLSVTLGQLISYALGAAFTEVPHGWRYMVAAGGIPLIILAFLLPQCPESPRQLLAHDKVAEATECITRIYPEATEEQVRSEVEYMAWTIQVEAQAVGDKSLWWQFKQLHCVPSNLRALITACAVMASVYHHTSSVTRACRSNMPSFSQLGGFNTLMYYSATLFSLVGFKKATAVSLVVGGTNFLFTLVNMLFIDRLGRRKILLITVMGIALSMVVAAIAFHWIPISRDLVLESDTVNWAGILILVTIIFYVAFFASGVATIGWVGTELLPIEVRALGTMMNTVTCWGCNIIIASTFLSMMNAWTPSGAFGFYAAICFFGWVFVVFLYPEVKGLPLEDVRQIFEHDFGVKVAARLQKEQKAKRQAGIA